MSISPSMITGVSTVAALRMKPSTAVASAPPGRVPPQLWEEYCEAEIAVIDIPNLDRLESYVATVKAIVRQATQDLTLRTDHGLTMKSRFRKLMYIQELKDTLNSIDWETLSQQNGMVLLKMLDLIRGLIVDVWC